MKKLIVILVALFLYLDTFSQTADMLCYLQIKQGTQIPFFIQNVGTKFPDLINGREDISLIVSKNNQNDTIEYYFPVFDAGFRFRYYPQKEVFNDSVHGYYFNNYRKVKIPFYGYSAALDTIFTKAKNDVSGWGGDWKIIFKSDSSLGLGEFDTKDLRHINGTILTPSGDYRFLHGFESGDTMKLYTIDGSHVMAFIFHKQPDGSLKGTQYSGTWGHEGFVCTRQPGFQLPDAYSLVKMQPGKNTFDFVLLEENGWPLSLNSKEYAHKPMLIQVMGSWCPNCMDESRYIISQYPDWHSKGLEVLGLCFEKYEDSATAYRRIAKMSNDLKMPYFATLAGKASVKEVFKLMPEMEGDVSFPTLIALDKNHHVKWIHTGFSGPATGMAYLQWKEEMEKEVAELVK